MTAKLVRGRRTRLRLDGRSSVASDRMQQAIDESLKQIERRPEVQKFASAGQLREAAGIGLEEAKRIMDGICLRADIARADSLDDLKAILLTLVDDHYPGPPAGFEYDDTESLLS